MPSLLPPNWPDNVAYLTTPVSSRRLPRELIATFCSSTLPPSPPPRLSIRRILDSEHPANGQSGLFNAGKAIPAGGWIIDYLGEVHVEADKKADSDYDLCLRRLESDVVGIDATYRGNEARFVNDYRGVPGVDRPNAQFELRTFDLGGSKGMGVRMSVWAGPKGVEKNSEILVSYGRGFWEARKQEQEAKDGGGASET